MSALWTASPGDDVKKLNLYETYAIGKRLSVIASISEDDLIVRRSFDLWFVRSELETYIGAPQLLPSSIRAAKKLISKIDDLVPRDPAKISSIDEQAKVGWRASLLRNLATIT